ncbi:NMCC_0638 family (lipo)protein [Pseudomonas sp. AU10]|uniref:NMCC_0638 family (lipo)protein n=1 Tax=Pseudomonas sp. AU10 TaxID=882697 RepID=UPI0021E27A09|nr:hypothetical protein [Pseudomonas sp. AU10]MCV2229698.1 hypothetical protein [Pseudomonas sp. AU10]
MYTSICVENINNLGNLKKIFKESSKLPPEESKKFLGITAGSSWVIPSEEGLFVLSIPDNGNTCYITASRANPQLAEDNFLKLVTSNVRLGISSKNIDFYAETKNTGKIHSVGYIWIVEGSKEKILFALTTSEHEYASTQVIATVKIISN